MRNWERLELWERAFIAFFFLLLLALVYLFVVGAIFGYFMQRMP